MRMCYPVSPPDSLHPTFDVTYFVSKVDTLVSVACQWTGHLSEAILSTTLQKLDTPFPLSNARTLAFLRKLKLSNIDAKIPENSRTIEWEEKKYERNFLT
ncbi:hypothetical protein V3C99_005182 [Haemonchus contortus]